MAHLSKLLFCIQFILLLLNESVDLQFKPQGSCDSRIQFFILEDPVVTIELLTPALDIRPQPEAAESIG